MKVSDPEKPTARATSLTRAFGIGKQQIPRDLELKVPDQPPVGYALFAEPALKGPLTGPGEFGRHFRSMTPKRETGGHPTLY